MLPDLRARIVREAVAVGVSHHEALRDADRLLLRLQREKIWVSPLYQVHVADEGGVLHYNLKRRDREPLMSRAHLVDIAQHFCKDRQRVPVEIYPAQQHVVDMANQYHIWAPSIRRAMASAAMRVALETPGKVVTLFSGEQVLHVALGSDRDWREVQALKNRKFGQDRDVLDLLLPESRDLGPILYALLPGREVPFGWRGGMQADAGATSLGAVQRPFSEAWSMADGARQLSIS